MPARTKVTFNEKGAKPRELEKEEPIIILPDAHRSFVGVSLGKTIGLPNYSSYRIDVEARVPFTPIMDDDGDHMEIEEAATKLAYELSDILEKLEKKYVKGEENDVSRNTATRARPNPARRR